MSNEQKPVTLDDVVAALQKNHETLEEIKVWAKINGVEKIQDVLKKTLNSPEKISVYHLSDGKPTREIGALCNVDSKTVSNYWKSWHRLGIVKSKKIRIDQSRYVKNFDLADYGIVVPKQKQEKTHSQPESQSTGGETNDE